MRRSTLLYLLPVLMATPAVAQGFEGTVTLKMPIAGTAMTDVKYLIKGDKMVSIMTMGPNTGPMAGKEIRSIIDRGTMTMTMLIPMEMGGMKGMKQVIDLNKATASNMKTPVEVRPLGTSDMIAGYKCENFEITEAKSLIRMCITKELGTFTYPPGGMGGGRGGAPGWAAALGSHPGFPLRVADGTGQVIIEVTGVHKGSVPASEFVIPDGYSDMGGMMGGKMGGRGGGH